MAGRGRGHAARAVFVDETHVNTAAHRRYGRGPRGGRVVGTAPHGRWTSLTVVAALTAVVDGPMTGDVVVLDNLRAHKGRRVLELVEVAGCRVEFLPPYSPDLDPIEMAFAKPKGRLRTLAARTVDGLVGWLGWLAHLFDPDECLRYIRHCGYPVTDDPKPL